VTREHLDLGGAAPTDAPDSPGAPLPARRRRGLPRALLVEARPKQWVKNVLVFVAPAAAGVLDQRGPFVDSCIAFVCFCLASAGTYYLNDAADVEADRLHPKKRFRPIAAGEIPVPLARVVGVLLIVGGVGLGFTARWQLSVVVASYIAITTVYTIWLKHVAVFDIVGVAAGFVLRAIAGAAAVDVPISNWFFIVASFGSLFMVVGKRRAETNEMGAEAVAVRSTLGDYTPEFLTYLQSVSTGVVLVAYCVWAFEKAADLQAHVPWFQLSIVPFALAILRYALLVDSGQGGAPEDVVLRDRPLQAMGVLMALLFAAGVYVS
jgi:decaprenyl-phosphate phosphoribosyltransferase